jgi:beta-glucanase (GH16 family)
LKTSPSEFHTYTIEWLPDQIRYSIDGKYYWKFSPGIFLNCPIYKQWPFDQDFYLILNTAVGGDWGGSRGVAETGWPQEMQVDYIRVYAIDQLQAILDSKK